MKSITDMTRALIAEDELLYEGLRQDLLNLRAAGRRIRSKIEEEKMEKVGLETIVVALSRIQNEIETREPIRPKVRLTDISMQTPLSTLTYPRAGLTQKHLSEIRRIIDNNTSKFCTMTEGFKEVTIIVPAGLGENILKRLDMKPSLIRNNLYAVSLHFDPKYLKQSNVLYSILGELAPERINLIEIISTATELSLIVEPSAVQKVTDRLNPLIA